MVIGHCEEHKFNSIWKNIVDFIYGCGCLMGKKLFITSVIAEVFKLWVATQTLVATFCEPTKIKHENNRLTFVNKPIKV